MHKQVFLAAALMLFTGAAQGADTEKELSKIDGVWEATSITRNGKEVPLGQYIDKLTVKGSKFIYFFNNGRTLDEGKVKLSPLKSPKEINLYSTLTRQNLRGGIYRRVGDTLTTCFYTRELPTEFQAGEGSGNTLIVWKKVK